MKYLFFAYSEQAWDKSMSAGERDAFENARRANDEALRQSGQLLIAEDLQSDCLATTVYVHGGEVFITDSPLTGGKETLFGVYLIDARDLNHAISVASHMPQAQAGPIKVRPVTEAV